MVFILLNIVVSFVLEIYDCANQEICAKVDRIDNAIFLRSRFDGSGSDSDKKLQELVDKTFEEEIKKEKEEQE